MRRARLGGSLEQKRLLECMQSATDVCASLRTSILLGVKRTHNLTACLGKHSWKGCTLEHDACAEFLLLFAVQNVCSTSNTRALHTLAARKVGSPLYRDSIAQVAQVEQPVRLTGRPPACRSHGSCTRERTCALARKHAATTGVQAPAQTATQSENLQTPAVSYGLRYPSAAALAPGRRAPVEPPSAGVG